ncbi:hypothetical protein FRC14_002589 [Serendipita sp. 396]|nr:hypothetical protein FRC14_002589 [Serendipita sp. 396]KAG8874681.1 hypothetical protein FRC20_005456 [Serendipita sp. 405]
MDASFANTLGPQDQQFLDLGIDKSEPVSTTISNDFSQKDEFLLPSLPCTPYEEGETTMIALSARAVPHQATSNSYIEQNLRPQGLSLESDRDFLTNRVNTSSLAPVDGGFGAWSFLFSAFFVELIVWGFPCAFGTFLDAYLRDPTYASQKNAQLLLPMIGTMTSGIIYCSGPVTYPLIYRYPMYTRISMWIGAAICFASLFGASYTTSVVNLVLCQGVLYAIGGTMLYNPCINYMNEWFIARRGLANGVISAGAAAGGLILPLVLPGIIDRYGTAKTLRIIAVVFAVCLLPMLPFLKGRLPLARVVGPAVRSGGEDRKWMKSPGFRFVMIVNTIQGFGYFVPLVWLPTFASELHLNATNSSLALSLLNGASLIGTLGFGALTDHMDTWLLAFSTLLGTCLATFVGWGVISYSLAGLIAFGMAYGVLAGGWSSFWPGFIKTVVSQEDPRLATTLMGYLMFSRGLGNILSTPITAAMAHPKGLSAVQGRLGFGVGNGKFENVIVYTGTCFAGASLIAGVGWVVEKSYQRSSTRR